MKVQNWLSAASAAHPQRHALVAAGRQLSYRELDTRAAGAEIALRECGVGPGDVVATTLSAGFELAELLHGSIRLGAALAPLDSRASAGELSRMLGSLGGPVLIEECTWSPADAAGEVTIELDDSLSIIHTSGSAGSPKPITLTAANHLWSAVGCGMRIGMQDNDRWLCCLPTHHIGGLAILIRTAIYGATAVLERFEADRTARTLADENVTIVSLVSTMVARLLEAGASRGQLGCALVGGGPVPQNLVDEAVARGLPIAPTYGMTEACSQVTTLAPSELHDHRGSAGRPISSAELTIDDDQRILVRGPMVAPAELAADGWLHTNDVGRLEDGYLHVLGRADEVMVSGGENVSPEEVESVLLDHPGIADVAVFGRPDPEWQTAIVARVVPLPGHSLDIDSLKRHCRLSLADFKVPKSFELADRLPRNAHGKLLRRELD